jgi:hypothetical protein
MRFTLGTEIEQVEAHVQAQLSGRVRDFRLSRREDGLVLQGYGHSYYAKQLAQHLVMESLKEPIAANEIQVS